MVLGRSRGHRRNGNDPRPRRHCGSGDGAPRVARIERSEIRGTAVPYLAPLQTGYNRRLFSVGLGPDSTNALRMHPRMLRRFMILLLLAIASVPARAQAPAPFDGSLQRLAEIMG